MHCNNISSRVMLPGVTVTVKQVTCQITAWLTKSTANTNGHMDRGGKPAKTNIPRLANFSRTCL